MILGSKMLSDESSSDSETGRFKGKSEKSDQQSRSTAQRDSHRSTGRDKHSENDRFHRAIDRKWDDKERSDRLPKERLRYSRYSSIRRRRSGERSPNRKKSMKHIEGHQEKDQKLKTIEALAETGVVSLGLDHTSRLNIEETQEKKLSVSLKRKNLTCYL